MKAIDVLASVDSSFRTLSLPSAREVISALVVNWSAANLTARITRGRKMRSLGGLFDEFAAAWQFPLYFGENRDAFDETLADLDSVDPRAGIVVVITEPEQVLIDAETSNLRWLVDSFSSAASVWSSPIESGEWWDRPGVPFHVVLAFSPDSLDQDEARWRAAGAVLQRMDAVG